MTYRLDLPDGTYYDVPDDMPREVAEQKVRAKHPELFQSRQETFGGALMKGGRQLLSDVQMLGEIPFVGKNEATKRAMERSQALQDEYGTGADFSRVKEAYGESGEGLLPAAGELVKQSGLAMTEMIPYLAELGISRKLGTKFGSPLTGLGLGAYAPRLSQNIQEQAAAQQEAGQPIDVDIEKAAGYAVPRAALDVAASILPLGKSVAAKIFGDDVVKLLEMGGAADAEVAARSRLVAAARGIGVNLAEQVPIQVAQAALGRMQLDKPLLSDDAFKEYAHAGYVAGLLSPMGAIGGLGERSAARKRLAEQTETAAPAAETAPPAPETPAAEPTRKPLTPIEIQEELFSPEETYSNKPFSIKDLSDEQLADVYGAKQPSTSTPFEPALPRSEWGKPEETQVAPKQYEERPATTPSAEPYSGQGWLPGMEPSWQHQFDEQAEAEQRAASESLATQSAEQLKLITAINTLPANKWVTPAFVARTLGVDIAQAREVMKTLEGDGYIANPNKAGWYKPTEKVAQDAPAIRKARMIGASNVALDEQRRAPMMGGRNVALDEQRRAPMIGGRNLFTEEQADVSDTTSDTGRDVGSISSEKSVERGLTRSTDRPVQQGRTEQPSTTETRTDRLASDRTPVSESDAGTERVPSTLDTLRETGLSLAGLTPEDRARVLRMPYVEAQQAMREANEPNVRWQMAADKNARADAARRAAVRNETERLASLARQQMPSRSERAVESLKKGNIGEALYHLMNEADPQTGGGLHPLPHREASSLQWLARSLFNTIHRGDIGEREKIIEAEIARRSQEIGETQNRSITEREKRDIRNRILNDHKLSKVDVLDVDGKLTAAGRIIYKAGKNGRPLVDKEGNLVRNFTPDSQRLVPLTGKAKLNTYSGDFEHLGGSKVPKGAFAGAEVVVEKPRMSGEDKAVIDRLKREGKLAEYDPKQNKFYFTEEGLNDRTMLHEMVHAATVKVLKAYSNEATRKNLSEAQRIGAQELNKIYEIAKKQLGEEHADALENIYEFASHAATDKRFQQALSEIPAGMLGTVTRRAQPSLWNMFTRALAKMFGLDHRQGKTAGNALLNASQAIHDILSIPERGTDVPPLAERAPPNTGTARANESAEKISKAHDEGNDKELLKQIGRAPLDWSHISDTPDFLEKARRAMSNLPATLRDGVNAFYSMDHLYQIYKNETPAIKMVDDVINARQAGLLTRKMNLRENLIKIQNMVKDNNYSKTQMNNFHDIAIQSTLHQIELLDRPEKKNEKGEVTQRARKRTEGALYDRYMALPEPMKKMYEMLRNDYDRMSDEYVAKLINGLNVTEAAKLRAKYEAARIPVYLPLYRRGKYWLSYKNSAGENKQAAFRSEREREQVAERIKNMGATEIKSYQKLSDLRENGPPPAGFLNDVLETMKKQGIKDQSIYDAVYETYLEYLPAQSVRQRFREREGILGMERDTFQSYANVATSMETLLNNLDFAPKLDAAIAKLREQASKHTENPGVMSAVRNIEAQVEFARNPKISNAVNKLGFFNYTWYLAANASSAVVNLTHLPMVVYPLLWGKHGTGPTEAAFANAFKQFKYKGQGKELVPKGYEGLYEEALKTGALFEHMGQELYDLRETSVEDYTGKTKRVFEKMNYLFTVTDRMNREATLMAGYDLALREMGTTKERATAEQHAKAAQDAIELVNKSYGTATLASGPRILQNSLARIMLTFKRFALNRMFILGRVFRDVFRGETQEIKDIAKRQLLGIYATAFAFSGVAGLPLYGAATMLANLLMDTDEDDPMDVDDLVRESVGDLAFRGPLNHALNLAVSHRVGWNDMFWTDDPKRLSEVGVFTYSLERALGPAYAQLLQIKPAVEHFANGRFDRGLELMTPVAARNILKLIRFGREGATTVDGEPIADVNAYNAIMQGFGFAPADVSETQSKSSAGLTLQSKIEARRKALLDQYYAAYNNGNLDALNDVNNSIARFNMKHPDYSISESTKTSSVRTREKRALDAINGINFNPKLQKEIMDKIGIEDNTQSFAKGGLVKGFAGGGHVESYDDGGEILDRAPDYAASVPDFLWNLVPFTAGTVGYGMLRPFTSAEEAQKFKDMTMEQYGDPVHRILDIENKPGPIGEAFNEAIGLARTGLQNNVSFLSDPRDAQEAVDAIMLGGPKVAKGVGRGVAKLNSPSGRAALKEFGTSTLQTAYDRAINPDYMGSNLDPARILGYPIRANTLYAVKPKGGNWLSTGERPGFIDSAPVEYGDDIVHTPEQSAAAVHGNYYRPAYSPEVQHWANTAIPKYIKNEMGTPQDPVRELFDKGVIHVGPQVGRRELGSTLGYELEELVDNPDYLSEEAAIEKYGDMIEKRRLSGYPEEGYAKTPAGKIWENLTDHTIHSLNLSKSQFEVAQLVKNGIEPGTAKFERFKDLVNRNYTDSEKKIILNHISELYGESPRNLSEHDLRRGEHDWKIQQLEPLGVNPDIIGSGIDTFIANNPYVFRENVGPSYYLDTRRANSYTEDMLGFGTVLDDLHTATTPELADEMGLPRNLRRNFSDLSKMTVPSAIELSHKIAMWKKKELEKQLNTSSKNSAQENFIEFDNGWKVVKFKHIDPEDKYLLDKPKTIDYKDVPGRDDISREFNSEGDYALASALWSESCRMGNCIGNPGHDRYFRGIKKGSSEAYSLRTPDNKAEVTMFFNKARPSESYLENASVKELLKVLNLSQEEIDGIQYDVSNYVKQFEDYNTSNGVIVTQVMMDRIGDREMRDTLLKIADERLPEHMDTEQIGGNANKNGMGNQSVMDYKLKPYIQKFLREYIKKYPTLEIRNGVYSKDLDNAGITRFMSPQEGLIWLTRDELKLAHDNIIGTRIDNAYMPSNLYIPADFAEALLKSNFEALPIEHKKGYSTDKIITKKLDKQIKQLDIPLVKDGPTYNSMVNTATNILGRIYSINKKGGNITRINFGNGDAFNGGIETILREQPFKNRDIYGNDTNRNLLIGIIGDMVNEGYVKPD